jgi:hypothetical protein
METIHNNMGEKGWAVEFHNHHIFWVHKPLLKKRWSVVNVYWGYGVLHLHELLYRK